MFDWDHRGQARCPPARPLFTGQDHHLQATRHILECNFPPHCHGRLAVPGPYDLKAYGSTPQHGHSAEGAALQAPHNTGHHSQGNPDSLSDRVRSPKADVSLRQVHQRLEQSRQMGTDHLRLHDQL